jgi:hypothetical protein
MLSSFPLLFFEGWSVVESGVDAKLFFGRLMAATAAAPQSYVDMFYPEVGIAPVLP